MTYMEEMLGSDPIRELEGQKLNDRWVVKELVRKEAFQTGSCFSVGYVVENGDGVRAFAKVLDFSRAVQEDDAAQALNSMTNEYIFEREILRICSDRGLSRVVSSLDFGEIPCKGVPLGKLFFIVLERASGDVRRYLSGTSSKSLS